MYTKRQRVENIRHCLTAAQGHLDSGARFVCHAINATYRVCDESVREDTKQWVMKALAPCYTFDQWMANRHPNSDFSPKRIAQLRRMWVRQLIKALTKQLNQ